MNTLKNNIILTVWGPGASALSLLKKKNNQLQ